ncbi:unnamed protein product [Zymoseptoria tritici ST99CH_3D7]|uniref:Domain of unknown function at the cortex 1 domain-containing protein n=1 Tax=Zymoseptoria tritici (strain ST99CH_3D7) TaxID=1276538 RepID=A0A1X7RNY9_ZYMT9|nr:unnamed protein product [Zymoseptoria tritici ST99CH_3D7]
MASAIKAKLTGGSAANDADLQEERDKYRLLVTAGPSYDEKTHKTVKVNSEIPTTIENEFLTAKINVRVKGFRGLPNTSPSTSKDYFDDPMHAKDQYSLGFSFVPKQDIPSVDTVWGNDFDHSIKDKIPPGFNTAFKIVKEFIDPGLSCDAYADQPWLYGPSLSCWFALRIGEKVNEGEDFPTPGVMTEGADGTGKDLRERLGLPENNEKRRKYFLDAKHRQPVFFEKGRCYQGDFYNPYLDFGNFSLKLPGFTLKVIKYVGDKTHCLRYVFKNRETGDMYFNVNFKLLWGEELQKALTADQKEQASSERDSGIGFQDQASDGATDGASNGVAASPSTSGEPQAVPTNDTNDESTRHTAPPTMQLHPGDHNAAAAVASAGSSTSDPDVDEIDRLLQQTSTSQKRSGLFLDEID